MKYASRAPIAPSSCEELFVAAVVGTGTLPAEVENVIDCSQSVTKAGIEPSPERTVEHMAEEVRV